jgi:hypothetical protein
MERLDAPLRRRTGVADLLVGIALIRARRSREKGGVLSARQALVKLKRLPIANRLNSMKENDV